MIARLRRIYCAIFHEAHEYKNYYRQHIVWCPLCNPPRPTKRQRAEIEEALGGEKL